MRLQHTGATEDTVSFDAPQFEAAIGRNWPTPWKVYQPWAAARYIQSVTRDSEFGAETQEFQWTRTINLSGTAIGNKLTTDGSPPEDYAGYVIPADTQADVTMQGGAGNYGVERQRDCLAGRLRRAHQRLGAALRRHAARHDDQHGNRLQEF